MQIRVRANNIIQSARRDNMTAPSSVVVRHIVAYTSAAPLRNAIVQFSPDPAIRVRRRGTVPRARGEFRHPRATIVRRRAARQKTRSVSLPQLARIASRDRTSRPT